MKRVFIVITLLMLLACAKEVYEPSPLQDVVEEQKTESIEPLQADVEEQKEDETEPQVVKEEMEQVMEDEMPPAAKLIAQAMFEPSAHDVAGKALIIEEGGTKILRFEAFETDPGPDLRIYLATDLDATDYIDLGPIKATKGDVNYEIDSGIDLSKYNVVLVWCRAFRVLFSYATFS